MRRPCITGLPLSRDKYEPNYNRQLVHNVGGLRVSWETAHSIEDQQAPASLSATAEGSRSGQGRCVVVSAQSCRGAGPLPGTARTRALAFCVQPDEVPFRVGE
jgi:hypothetical protein